MTAARAGARLGGRYRLTERLAFGGMGEVWQGVDEVLGRAVAVKILRPELARDDAFRRRFREEARTAGGLYHPGIAAVYDYGEGAPVPPATPAGSPTGRDGFGDADSDWSRGDEVSYLVMELVPGKPLSGILADSGPLLPIRALDLVAQAARALHAAHQRGVVHRDVKPANLMVTPDQRVKVTDFGIARPQDHEPLTATGQVMGTAHYLAPELARGQLATPLSDVYALGVVAYECVAGHRPFEGDNQVAVATAHLSEDPPPLPDSLPPDLRRVIMTAMQKDPSYRFVSAEAFAEVCDLVRFRLAAGDPPPVWAVRGPVPGVGAGGPPTPGGRGRATSGPTPGYAATTAYPGADGPGGGRMAGPGGNGHYGRTGYPSGETPYGPGYGPGGPVTPGGPATPGRPGQPGRPGSTGTAALPLDAYGHGMSGGDGPRSGSGSDGRRRQPRRKVLSGPLLALLALVALVAVGAAVQLLSRNDSTAGNPTVPSAPTVEPTTSTGGAAVPTASIPSESSSSRSSYPQYPSSARSRSFVPSVTATVTTTVTTTHSPSTTTTTGPTSPPPSSSSTPPISASGGPNPPGPPGPPLP
ncbi:MAG TPA: serine/threonine-protein kinase [Kineosporiaceae bacterium]|nr:serine/threonine-protein kinase [Kineosporiaceae bacterium]